MRNERFDGNRTPSRLRATPHACRLRSRPDPVVQHMVECESDGMLNRAARGAGCAGADYLVGIGEQRPYGKSCSIGSSLSLRCQGIRRYVGPKRVRRIGPGTAFVDSLPHLIKSRVISTACLQVDQNVSISRRVAGALHRRIRWNWTSDKVGLIYGGCNRYVRLVVRNFNGWNSIREGSIRIVPEEWLDRRC